MVKKQKKAKQSLKKTAVSHKTAVAGAPSSAKPVANKTARKRPLLRVIPLTILIAFGLLMLKSVEIWQGAQRVQQAWLVASANAADEEEKEKTSSDEETDGEDVEEAAKAEEPPAPPEDMFRSKESPYSAREVDVLEKLSERREKLDEWEREIALREKVLEAAEKRIELKLSEMKALQEELQKQLVAYDDEENAKLRSLVKIYETMKPKDAARIFDQMDMDVLLMVIDRMSERRAAPILASMSPLKAKEVTQQLADEQKLQKPLQERIEKQSLDDMPGF